MAKVIINKTKQNKTNECLIRRQQNQIKKTLLAIYKWFAIDFLG